MQMEAAGSGAEGTEEREAGDDGRPGHAVGPRVSLKGQGYAKHGSSQNSVHSPSGGKSRRPSLAAHTSRRSSAAHSLSSGGASPPRHGNGARTSKKGPGLEVISKSLMGIARARRCNTMGGPGGRRMSSIVAHKQLEEDIDEASHESDEEEEEEEELVGVLVKKVSEQVQDNELNKSPTAVLLGQTKLFKGFSDQVIAQLAGGCEPRLFRPGEMIYREGERQQWLGIMLSGAATVHIAATGEVGGVGADSFGTARPEIASIPEGAMFGELCALRVRETRTGTVIADADCQVVMLEGKVMWDAVEAAGGEEKQTLLSEAERWRAFLSSRFAAQCHPEIAYQLRMRSTFRVLAPGEELVFGYCEFNSSLASEQSTHLPLTTAVLETGRLLAVAERREMLSAGAVLGENAVLGVKGATVISCPEGVCQLACFTREAFWKLVGRFTKEREGFTKLALERLPLSTLEVSWCPLLTHIQGPQAQAGMARTIQSLVRQRVVHPGADICTAEGPDVLFYFQQGSARVIVADHNIRVVEAGGYCGELNFVGASSGGDVKVLALELCVLQELRRADLEAQLGRQHSIRARFRELSKLKKFFRQDASTVEQQVRQLQFIPFFADCSEEFLTDVSSVLEERIFVPGQVIMSPSDSSAFMSILLEGTAERKLSTGISCSMQPGETVGEMGLLSSSCGSKESVTATTVCCVQTLHRMVLLSRLSKHPQVKRHFEEVAKAYMLSQGIDDTNATFNIYSLPFFKNSCSRFLYLIDIHMERKVFFSDEVIVQEGTHGREMYILYSGTADVVVKETKVGSLTQGQTFGEMAILGLVQKRSATITATSLCDVRIISAESWERAIKEFPEERSRFESLAAAHQRHSLERQSGGKVRQTSQFFSGCDPGFASAISDLMEDQLFLEGQPLMNEGEEGDWMALLHQGKAAVSVNGVKVAELKSGDVLGEMAVMGISSARTATVTALETCFVQVLHRAQLLPVLEDFPDERRRIRMKAASRLEQRWKGDTVRTLEIFQGCPRVFTDFLDQRTQRWVFFSGDKLCTQGSTGSYMFVLLSGQVDVEFDGEVVAELKGGSVIGEFVALGISDRRTASLRCREICDIYSLSRKDMRAAFDRWPEQNKRLMSLAATRMRKDYEKKRGSEKSPLHNCQLFQQCSDKFLECISNHLEDKLFLKGDFLCKEGERGDSMYILLIGVFDCIVGTKKVSELQEGSIIGEIAVLGFGTARTATLRAQTTCLVQQLRGPVFMKYLQDFTSEMARFQEVGAARLEQLAVNAETNLFKYQALFRDCSAEFLDRMTPLLRRKFFFADQIIFKDAVESSEMFAIAQGRAVVERKGKRVGHIEAGLSLGEMAVLGLAPEYQSLTIRAEVLCDTQVLSRADFEPLLEEFPAERAHLLDVAAQMMREDLAGVSNLDILTEIPLLQELDNQLVAKLNRVVSVSLWRKGDLIFKPGDTSFFVLLQGSAEVEVEGAPGRPLTEGDTFGEIALLGLAENENSGVRATRTCLILSFTQKDFHAAVAKMGPRCRSQLQNLAAKLTDTQGMRHTVVERCPVFQSLKLSEEQLSGLPSRCEEVVFASEQEILSRHLRSEVVLFMVTGKASIGHGRDAVQLEAGSFLGELTVDPVRCHHHCGIYAMVPSQVLILHRKAFLSYVDTFAGDDRGLVLARLQAKRPAHLLLQDQRVSVIALTLRQRAQMLAEQCMTAAKGSVEATITRTRSKPPKARAKKMWKMAKLTMMIKGPLQAMHDGVKGPESEGEASKPLSRQASEAAQSHTEASSGMGSQTLSSRSLGSRRRLATVQEKRKAAEQEQESLLIRDIQRLTDEAKRATAAAKQEQVQLRKEAAELRRKLNAADGIAEDGTLSVIAEEDARSLPPDSPYAPSLDPCSPLGWPATSRASAGNHAGSLPPESPGAPSQERPRSQAAATRVQAQLTPRRNDVGAPCPAGGGCAQAGAAPPVSARGAREDSEANQVASAKRRVDCLHAKLVQACRRREELLRQLQQRCGAASSRAPTPGRQREGEVAACA